MESIKRVERFQHEFDDLFERFGFARRRLFKEEQSTSIRPPIESYVEGDDYKIRVELPGVDPKDVDIRVAGGVLTIKGSSDESMRRGSATSLGANSTTARSSGLALWPTE